MQMLPTLAIGAVSIDINILEPREAKKLKISCLGETVGEAQFIEPGNSFMAKKGVYPVIIAVTGQIMMVAPVSDVSSVRAALSSIKSQLEKMLYRQGEVFSEDDIAACMYFGNERLESEFLDQSVKMNIIQVWSLLQRRHVRQLAHSRTNHIVVKRKLPSHLH